VHRLFDGLLKRVLVRAFEQRHQTVQAQVTRGRLASVAILILGVCMTPGTVAAQGRRRCAPSSAST
jgi:hypothetical protein